jgi:hypothetical protein
MLRLINAIVVGTAAYLLLGWLVFEKLLGEYTTANTTSVPGFRKDASTSSFVLLLLSCFSYSALLSLILGNWKKVKTPTEGMKTGAIVGTLVAIMTDSYWYATSNFYNDFKPMIADILAATATVGAMGLVIASVLLYKRTSLKTESDDRLKQNNDAIRY